MSKVKVFRASGNPIDPAHIEEFHKLHAEIYDKVKLKYVKDTTKALDPALSARLEKLFNWLNKRVFMKKFPHEVLWDEVCSKEQWLEKVEHYGNICISKNRDNGELIYVILDVEV